MRELYTIQPEESQKIITNGSFKIKHPTLNKYWSLEGDALKVNSGTPVIFTLEKKSDIYENTNPWGALKTGDGKYIRHSGYVMWANPWTANNFDFAWIFYKQNDGSYRIFNPYPGPSTPGTFVGYDASADRVLIVNPDDVKVVNWQLEFTNSPPPVTSASSTPAPGPAPVEIGEKGPELSGGHIAAIILAAIFVIGIIIFLISHFSSKKPATTKSK